MLVREERPLAVPDPELVATLLDQKSASSIWLFVITIGIAGQLSDSYCTKNKKDIVQTKHTVEYRGPAKVISGENSPADHCRPSRRFAAVAVQRIYKNISNIHTALYPCGRYSTVASLFAEYVRTSRDIIEIRDLSAPGRAPLRTAESPPGVRCDKRGAGGKKKKRNPVR